MPMLVQDSLDEAMTALVQKVIDQLMRFAGNSMTDDGPGCKAVPPAGDTNTDPICSTKADLMAVMDPSQGDSSLQAQKVFLSEMALAMDIGWNKSYVQVVSGVDGQVLLDKWNYTNKARLACDAQHISVPSGQLDLMQTLDALITYYGNLLDQERSDMTARSNTQVLLLMRASTRIDNEDDVAYKLNTLCDMFPDLNIFTLTDNPNVFSGVQQKMDRRQFLSDNMFTTESSQQGIRDTLVPKVNSQMCQTPSRFVYPACNTDNLGYTYNENNHEYTHFITPGRVAYLRLGPEQFFSSSDLKLQFESTFGSLQFCISREDPMPADGGDDVTCMSTESVSTSQVEFTFNAPCNEDQMNGDCPPFYISIQQNPASTSTDNVNLCSDDECPFPNSIRYTLKHENMRCNSVSSLAVPAFLLAAAALLRQVAQ
ncbi:uncharacterized protein LOC119097123 [Pollicipes pollicipes]|uniref:uncharacterized protein LOC119097123 n=1 Tax=Pollicipes pollicipes TaxID=41117 RepID=UPI0018853364|nr:uncharacterized protein LOC119097123 [Pollicipes pollicipes]